MRTLHYWRYCPFSRQARMAVLEKGIKVRLREERVWDGRQSVLALYPSGAPPVLTEPVEPHRRECVFGARAVIEYLEEVAPKPSLMPEGALARGEARRLADWFDRKFDAEVNATLAYEQLEKQVLGLGAPDAERMAAGAAHLERHLAYVAQLAEDRFWLAGEKLTIADVAAAAHLSIIDELGDIDWSRYPAAQDWWGRIARRASFRALAADAVAEQVACAAAL